MQNLTLRHTLAPLFAVFAIGVSAPAAASEAIVKKARCVACHAVDAKRVGPAYKEVAAKYGIGEKTGIDIPSEINGTIAGAKWKKARIKENWYGGDTVNYGIGQGYVLVTPLQMARAYASIANGGKLLKPRLNASSPVEYKILDIDPAIIKIYNVGCLM